MSPKDTRRYLRDCSLRARKRESEWALRPRRHTSPALQGHLCRSSSFFRHLCQIDSACGVFVHADLSLLIQNHSTGRRQPSFASGVQARRKGFHYYCCAYIHMYYYDYFCMVYIHRREGSPVPHPLFRVFSGNLLAIDACVDSSFFFSLHAGLHLYFVSESGSTWRTSLLHRPYFYLSIKNSSLGGQTVTTYLPQLQEAIKDLLERVNVSPSILRRCTGTRVWHALDTFADCFVQTMCLDLCATLVFSLLFLA